MFSASVKIHVLLELVGKHDAGMMPNNDIYYTIGGFGAHCGNAYTYIVFHFKSEKLFGWRQVSDGMNVDDKANVDDEDESWITRNMVFKDEERRCLVEKSIR